MKTNEKDLQILMGFESQKNVSDRLFQKISELIMSGELEEGYTFPNETVLCEQLNVGRTSLREAYKALELSGYVTRTKKGTVVNSRMSILNATPLRTVFHGADHEDFTRFRLIIEPQCAALAAANAGLKDVEKLDDLIRQSEDALILAQSCPTLCDPMDCSPPGSSVHEIFQARIMEWVANSFTKGSSRPRDRTRVSVL